MDGCNDINIYPIEGVIMHWWCLSSPTIWKDNFLNYYLTTLLIRYFAWISQATVSLHCITCLQPSYSRVFLQKQLLLLIWINDTTDCSLHSVYHILNKLLIFFTISLSQTYARCFNVVSQNWCTKAVWHNVYLMTPTLVSVVLTASWLHA